MGTTQGTIRHTTNVSVYACSLRELGQVINKADFVVNEPNFNLGAQHLRIHMLIESVSIRVDASLFG